MTRLKEKARNGVKKGGEGSKEKGINGGEKKEFFPPNIFHISCVNSI
jgi:hypothetical protein